MTSPVSEAGSAAAAAAAARLVETLAGDAEFVAAVAEAEITRRVAAGDLVPRARLEVAPGLEITPRGRVTRLENALRALCSEITTRAELLAKAGCVDLVKAATRLQDEVSDAAAVEPEPEPSPPPRRRRTPTAAAKPKAKPRPRPKPAAKTAPVPAPPSPPAPTAEKRATIRPAMPEPTDHPPCDACGTTIDEDGQALISFAMFKRPLCSTCHSAQTAARKVAS